MYGGVVGVVGRYRRGKMISKDGGYILIVGIQQPYQIHHQLSTPRCEV